LNHAVAVNGVLLDAQTSEVKLRGDFDVLNSRADQFSSTRGG